MATTNKIPIKQGEAFQVQLKLRDVDTGLILDLSTGFTAKMEIRNDEQDTVVRDALSTDDGNTGDNGRIVLSDGVPATGSTETDSANITLDFDTAASVALDLSSGRGTQETYQGVGDVEIKNALGEVVSSIRLVFAQTLEVTKI